MKLLYNRKYVEKDAIYLLLYIIIFIIISQGGMLKYVILTAGILFALLVRKKQNSSYFFLLIHALIYSIIGLLLGILCGTISFNSIKQLLIYLCSGLFSISFFSLYGKKDSKRLVDIQFIGLCLAYILLYGRYLSISSFYYESNIYAYIFAVYGLLYLWQGRYKTASFAIIFMLIDHKRIATYSFVLVALILLIVKQLKMYKRKKIINRIAAALLIIVPILWVYYCSNGYLVSLFYRFRINTMGRVEGTGAWNIARKYYSFSPLYVGKGIGWVLEWLKNANIISFSNLHNDFLTGYIELGFVGFLVWILSFQLIPKLSQNKDLSTQNFIYIVIGFMFMNFLTDNIYLYVTFLLPFYTILLYLIFGEDKETYSKTISGKSLFRKKVNG